MCIINVKVNFLSVFLVRCLELGFKFESLKVRKRVKLAVESTTIFKTIKFPSLSLSLGEISEGVWG